MHVQFVDLTTTIHVKRGIFDSDTTLRSVLNFFTTEWTCEKITVNGSAVNEAALEQPIEDLGESDLQIEQHK